MVAKPERLSYLCDTLGTALGLAAYCEERAPIIELTHQYPLHLFEQAAYELHQIPIGRANGAPNNIGRQYHNAIRAALDPFYGQHLHLEGIASFCNYPLEPIAVAFHGGTKDLSRLYRVDRMLFEGGLNGGYTVRGVARESGISREGVRSLFKRQGLLS